MSAVMCLSDCDEAGRIDEAGLTNVNDVVALDASLDADVEATNTAAQACSALSPSDRTSWGGFYSAWKAEHEKVASYTQAGWWNLGAKIDEVLLAGSLFDELQGYSSTLHEWQGRIKRACPSYQPPPGPPTPPTPPAPADWTGAIKWGAAALVVVIVASQVGLPRLFGAGGLFQSSRRARA